MSLLLKSNNVHLMHAADTPHTNAYICKALGSSAKELTIEEFIAITAYPINPIMFNYFWQVILNNQSPHVGGLLLEYFGYESSLRFDICISNTCLYCRSQITYI